MSSIKVISCIMPLSAPPETYPKYFLDWCGDKHVETMFYTDERYNETYRIETIYCDENTMPPNFTLSNATCSSRYPNFIPLPESRNICSLSSDGQCDRGFLFSIPLQVTDSDKSKTFPKSNLHSSVACNQKNVSNESRKLHHKSDLLKSKVLKNKHKRLNLSSVQVAQNDNPRNLKTYPKSIHTSLAYKIEGCNESRKLPCKSHLPESEISRMKHIFSSSVQLTQNDKPGILKSFPESDLHSSTANNQMKDCDESRKFHQKSHLHKSKNAKISRKKYEKLNLVSVQKTQNNKPRNLKTFLGSDLHSSINNNQVEGYNESKKCLYKSHLLKRIPKILIKKHKLNSVSVQTTRNDKPRNLKSFPVSNLNSSVTNKQMESCSESIKSHHSSRKKHKKLNSASVQITQNDKQRNFKKLPTSDLNSCTINKKKADCNESKKLTCTTYLPKRESKMPTFLKKKNSVESQLMDGKILEKNISDFNKSYSVNSSSINTVIKVNSGFVSVHRNNESKFWKDSMKETLWSFPPVDQDTYSNALDSCPTTFTDSSSNGSRYSKQEIDNNSHFKKLPYATLTQSCLEHVHSISNRGDQSISSEVLPVPNNEQLQYVKVSSFETVKNNNPLIGMNINDFAVSTASVHQNHAEVSCNENSNADTYSSFKETKESCISNHNVTQQVDFLPPSFKEFKDSCLDENIEVTNSVYFQTGNGMSKSSTPVLSSQSIIRTKLNSHDSVAYCKQEILNSGRSSCSVFKNTSVKISTNYASDSNEMYSIASQETVATVFQANNQSIVSSPSLKNDNCSLEKFESISEESDIGSPIQASFRRLNCRKTETVESSEEPCVENPAIDNFRLKNLEMTAKDSYLEKLIHSNFNSEIFESSAKELFLEKPNHSNSRDF